MWLQPEEGAALPQKITAIAVVANWSQLECHHPGEPVIDGLEHARLAPATHRLEHLIPTLEQRDPCIEALRHRRLTPSGASRPRDNP
jgi:hypothetical protein